MTDHRHGQPLIAKLTEDLSSPDEAEQTLPVIQRLEHWHAPTPTADQTAHLAARLAARLSVAPPASFHTPHSALRIPNFAILLLRAQLRVVRRELWLASTLIMTLGLLVTLTFVDQRAAGDTLPIALIAPLVAALGITFVYGPLVDPAIEIELATAVSPRLILLARLVLTFGFNLMLGLLASALLAGLRAEIVFWPLVTTWLAPMAFLSALAFLLTIVTTEPILGMLISLVLWFLQVARRMPQIGQVLWYVPDLLAASAHVWLWALAVLLGGLALWIGGREEHWLSRQA